MNVVWIIVLTILGLAIVGGLIYLLYAYFSKQAQQEEQKGDLFQKDVDLTKYAGKWYEIARLPNNFEEGCLCSNANYELQADGTVIVTNQCQLPDNEVKEVKGLAWPANKENTWLNVSFAFGNNGIARKWPFSLLAADYWILYVDDDYKTAVVGSPSQKYLWFLSRTPTVSAEAYANLVNIAKAKGYDTDSLQMSCKE